MPFVLKNAGRMFQSAMDVILSSVKWQFALVYFDDIIIFSMFLDEHIHDVRQFLTLLNHDGVTLTLKKREIFTNCIEHLCKFIKLGRLKVSSHTIDAIHS